MAKTPDGPHYIDEHHQRIAEFAGDYFDDDEEREAFVDTLMERRGYKRTTAWAVPDPTAPEDGSAGGAGGGGQQQPRRAPYFKR